MYQKRKERLYITDIMEDPPISYPMYYTLSTALKDNEMLHESLFAIHLSEFERYETPLNSVALFNALASGVFPIYKEQYVVGSFGGKLMYLEASGWKSLGVTEGIFDMHNWLV
ncbi:MAG: hypothetical protein K0U47_09230 [Epsilonproteobacteria bacterium]|nr:hypothetical protein [Campylobacterota bacterium]